MKRRKEFTALARPHLDGLYRTALRMTEDRGIAEEMVQETCLKAYAQYERYQADTNFKAWLFRILTNLCIDHLRRQNVLSITPIEALPVETPLTDPNKETSCPERQAMGQDTKEAITSALSALAPELRAVVMLILVEELSYAEAAVSLELPVGTVRSRLHRARGELQERLRKQLDVRPTKPQRQTAPRLAVLFS